jgi:hypothetical protein
MSTEGTASTKQAATLSLATQIGTKAINLGLSVLFVRLAAPDCVGLFTLLLASAQLVSSLGRLGMNYSFTVLLPRQVDAAAQLRLTSTYSLFSLASSLLVASLALWQLAQTRGMASTWHSHFGLFAGLILTYLLSDASSEILWSIHLALGRFRAVFFRDVWLALGKGVLPLAGAVWFGALGMVTGLGLISLLNCWIAATLVRRQPLALAGPQRMELVSWPLLRQLLTKGLPFFSVPLVNNLILWPLLLKVVHGAGIDKLDGLRVAQICAQVIGIFSASLMPVLWVKSSHDEPSAERMHQRAFQACWVISIVIYCLYALSDNTLLPLVFGRSASDGTLQIARILVVAAAVQGLSQMPMQRPLPTGTLIRLSILQIGSLILAALAAIHLFNPEDGLLAYASVNLISPLLTVLFLPALLRQSLVADSFSTLPLILLSALLLSTCFLRHSGLLQTLQTALLLGSLAVMLISNRELLLELKPGR